MRGYPAHPYLCQEWRLLDTHSEMPHKQGLLEVYEIFFNRGIRAKIQFAATTTDTKNIRLTKQRWFVRSDSPFTKRSGDMVYNSWLD